MICVKAWSKTFDELSIEKDLFMCSYDEMEVSFFSIFKIPSLVSLYLVTKAIEKN